MVPWAGKLARGGGPCRSLTGALFATTTSVQLRRRGAFEHDVARDEAFGETFHAMANVCGSHVGERSGGAKDSCRDSGQKGDEFFIPHLL